MLVLRELTLYLCANSQSGRIGSQALREISLDLLQFAKELVVVGVRNGRAIEDVVFVGRAREKRTQLGGAAMLLRARC
jgi:hypothetical protein